MYLAFTLKLQAHNPSVATSFKNPHHWNFKPTIAPTQAAMQQGKDYCLFGAPMPGRQFNNGSYRFGFNGQEKDDEIAGAGNSNTAEYWQYDTRLGRRWNRDKVVKPWESSYAAFSNSPLIFVDPNGNDDYYNKAGKYLGNDGSGTNIRITNMITTKKQFEYVASQAGGVEVLKSSEHSQEVKIMAGQEKAIQKLYDDSQQSGKERTAYVVLDVENATLSLEEQAPSPKDDEHSSHNEYGIGDGAYGKQQGGDHIYVKGSPNKVIVGQVHGHPSKDGEILKEGVSEEGGSNVKKGESDVKAAENMKVPVYAVDKYSIHKVDQKSTITNCQPKTTEVLKDALETSGGKEK